MVIQTVTFTWQKMFIENNMMFHVSNMSSYYGTGKFYYSYTFYF